MTDITRDILIRVAWIHRMRKLREPLMFALFISVCVLVSSAFFVSFGSVVHNFPAVSEPVSFGRFLMMAFLNTELFVKVALIALSIACARYTFLAIKGTLRVAFSLVGFKKVETALS